MAESVNGIRERYYRDMIHDYQILREKSFLYRAFWAERVKELLKESLPQLPGKKELRKQMEELSGGFLEHLTREKNRPEQMEKSGPEQMEENGPEQMEQYYEQLPKEVKELLEVHLPQLPESIVELLREHFNQLPERVRELLKGCFPWLLEEEESWQKYEAEIRRLLKENMLERPKWADQVLLKKPPKKEEAEKEQEKQKKERRDFWQDLVLNDAGYKAGLITDTEYYLWLTEYLTARDIYYKDNSMRDGHTWLYRLLREGLGRKLGESVRLDEIRKLEKEIRKLEKSRKPKESKMLEKIREMERLKEPKEPQKPQKPGMPRKEIGNIRDKAGVGRDLAELAEKLRHEAETGGTEISDRLHNLERRIKLPNGQTRREDYLPWLTRQLEKMAIHIKIKTWLQDNGYSLAEDDKGKKLLQERRKQDFSMRLFEAYCDSEKGYDFSRKEEGGREADEGWKVSHGFCVWQPDDFEKRLQTLLEALKRMGKEYFYLPLAMDLRSGCVFFLAGKGYYESVYDKGKDKEEYRKSKVFFCYDYLRLDKQEGSEGSEPTYRLQPTFHKNVGKSYQKMLQEFKWYCGGAKQIVGQDVSDGDEYYCEEIDDSPRQKIKASNEEAIGIPKAFQWAFESPEDLEFSREAREDFEQTARRVKKIMRP